MNDKRKFRAYCLKCDTLLRSQQRLQHHKASRCNYRIWPRKRRRGRAGAQAG
ncbi:hypothetical protein [Pseudohalioglobus lutimaris]|uniref:hypothetical protein n=1 Tax=Pseudohalioglobus lutimaris TaxID=1737061 RepID=UPI001A9D6B28|nr:hypothetical protein [Pseudohalioglobus lutimaris]